MSARSCVVSSTVTPRSRFTSARNCRTARLRARRRARSSARRGRRPPGSCSSAAVSSPRIRWPSESWRTGVARNGPRSSCSREAVEARAVPRPPGRDRCGGAARTSRASGRSHQSCERWPNTTPMRRASSIRCREGSRPATRIRPRARARGSRSASSPSSTCRPRSGRGSRRSSRARSRTRSRRTAFTTRRSRRRRPFLRPQRRTASRLPRPR